MVRVVFMGEKEGVELGNAGAVLGRLIWSVTPRT